MRLFPFLLSSFLFGSMCLMSLCACAQPDFYNGVGFTEADTLRGMLRPERTCYDVLYYDLEIQVQPTTKYVQGVVRMRYKAVENFKQLQIDLFKNMTILRIAHEGRNLKYQRRFDAVFVEYPDTQAKGTESVLLIEYEGIPTIAENAPWDGGFVWKKDSAGKAWVGLACEGLGASLWYPNKDHLSDEPDSARIVCSVPDGLMCVCNGRLVSQQPDTVVAGFQQFDWRIGYPINNYNLTLNIGDYVHFSEVYTSKVDGSTMPCDYYVLPESLLKARKQFVQVNKVLEAYEHYFGKYPFWNDGFALVETPYLGMEHQGAIAYGNGYQNGYLGQGGMNENGIAADYIIVHETGHEYFGNSISCGDLAEMWIHESFTTYMESLFVEYHYGYEQAVRYLYKQSRSILNREPIIGPKDVNWEDWSGSDHYYKGAYMLHTLRHSINDDVLWFKLLRSFYEKYQISIITTDDFVNHVNSLTGKDYSAFFDQYLRHAALPVFEYELMQKGNKLVVRYRLKSDVTGFAIPIKIGTRQRYSTVYANDGWQTVVLKKMKAEDFRVGQEFSLVATANRSR